MLKYEEFRPQFVSFGRHISARRAGQLTLQEFAEHREAFGAFLVQLEARLNWEAPLVALFSEAGETLAELPQHLTTLRQELENDGIESGAAEDLHRSLERFRHLQAQLPVMCDVEVFNEILLLAGPVKEQARALDREALLQRLPAALDWLNAQEASWSLFGALFEIIPLGRRRLGGSSTL